MRDVRQHARGVDVDGVAAGRLDDGHAVVGDVAAQVAGGDDAVAQVVGVQHLLQADGDGVEVAAGESAVGGEALGEDEQVGLLLEDAVVVGAEQAADVGEGVLLGGEGAAVGEREHLLRDLFRRPIGVAGLALADEPGVLGEAAGVQVERESVAGTDGFDGLDVGHRDGLAAAGVVGDGEHDQRDVRGAFARDQCFQRGDVHVALEIQAGLGIGGLGQREVHGARAGELDVGARGIEVRVGGDDVAGLAHHGEEDAFGGASLVRGDHVAEAGELVHHAFQAEETLAAGVGFVAAHDGRPLLGGHGAGAGIGEQVDQDVAGFDEEEVVAGVGEIAFALFGRGVAQGSTLLMRKGSMMVRTSGLSHPAGLGSTFGYKSRPGGLRYAGRAGGPLYCSMTIWTRLLSTPSAVR